MKKIVSAIFLSSALLLSACADKSSDKQETYSTVDIFTDRVEVETAEKELKPLGFEFVESGTSVSWDDARFSNRWTKEEAFRAADSQILPALKRYKEAVKAYLNKYSRAFTLQYDDGRKESDMSLKPEIKASLKGRLELVSKTITAVENRKW